MKVVQLDRAYWPRGGYGHYCPGCRSGHEIDTEQKNSVGAIWKFNGDTAIPSFTPSINMRINTPDMKGYNSQAGSTVCHYFIKTGDEFLAIDPTLPGVERGRSYIQYCGDSTHALKGKTVELPDIPPHLYFTSRRLAEGKG